MNASLAAALEDVLSHIGNDPEHPPSLSAVLSELAKNFDSDTIDQYKTTIADTLEHKFLNTNNQHEEDDEDINVSEDELDSLIPDPAKTKKLKKKSSQTQNDSDTPKRESKRQKIEQQKLDKKKKSVKEKLQNVRKIKKKKKLPGEPPKARTAFFIFGDEMRPQFRANNPDVTFSQLSKMLGDSWKELPQDDRNQYLKLAEIEKEQRKAEIEEWRRNNRDLIEGAKSRSPSPDRIKARLAGNSNAAPLSIKIPKKLRKLRESQTHEEEPGEMVTQEPGPEEPKTTFDQVLEQSKKKSSRKFQVDEETVEHVVQNLLHRMDTAYLEDLELMNQNKPATKKLSLCREVVTWMSKKHFQRSLLDEGILSRIRDWLRPLADNSLPNENLRLDMYNMFDTLPLDFGDMLITDYLAESADNEGYTLGMSLMDLWRRESPRNKALLRDIIERWSRPLFGSVASYKQLAEVEAQNASEIQYRSRKLSNAQSTEPIIYHTYHAKRPEKATFDYAIRPESQVDIEVESRKRGRADDGIHQRINKKLQASAPKAKKTRR